MESIRTALGLTPGSPLRVITQPLLVGCGIVIALLALGPMLGLNMMILTAIGSAFPISLLILIPFNLAHARSLRRIVDGDYLARWSYEPAELGRFAEREAVRAGDEARTAFRFSLGFSVAFGALFGLLTGSPVVAFTALGIGLFATLLLSASTFFGGRAVAAGWKQPGCELFISPAGIYRPPSAFTPLSGVNLWVSKVELESGSPTALRFDVRSTTRRGAEVVTEIRVPVPRGHDDEARSIVERFQREIPLAA